MAKMRPRNLNAQRSRARHDRWHFRSVAFALLIIGARTADAVNILVATTETQVGVTPKYIGYSMGHYLPGSNTSGWVDYSDVNAFRVWLSPGDYEPTDDISPSGDGVTSLASFNA